MASVCSVARNTLSGILALYERWDQSLCAPAVMPSALSWYSSTAATRQLLNKVSTAGNWTQILLYDKK